MLKFALSSTLLLGWLLGLCDIGHAQDSSLDVPYASLFDLFTTVPESNPTWEKGQTVDDSHSGYWVEIGPFKTFDEAKKAWAEDLEGSARLSASIISVDHGATYRIHVVAPDGYKEYSAEVIHDVLIPSSECELYDELPGDARGYMADPENYRAMRNSYHLDFQAPLEQAAR